MKSYTDSIISSITAIIFVSIAVSFYFLVLSKISVGFNPHLLNIFGLIVTIGGTCLIILPTWYTMRLRKERWNESILNQNWVRMGVITLILGMLIQILSSWIQYSN